MKDERKCLDKKKLTCLIGCLSGNNLLVGACNEQFDEGGLYLFKINTLIYRIPDNKTTKERPGNKNTHTVGADTSDGFSERSGVQFVARQE